MNRRGSNRKAMERISDEFNKLVLEPERSRSMDVTLGRNIRETKDQKWNIISPAHIHSIKQMRNELDGVVHPDNRDCNVGFDLKKIEHFHQTNLRMGFTLKKMESFYELDTRYDVKKEYRCCDESIHLNHCVEGREYFEAREKCYNLAWVEFHQNKHLFPAERIDHLAIQRDIYCDYDCDYRHCSLMEKIIGYELDPYEVKMWIYNEKLNSRLRTYNARFQRRSSRNQNRRPFIQEQRSKNKDKDYLNVRNLRTYNARFPRRSSRNTNSIDFARHL